MYEYNYVKPSHFSPVVEGGTGRGEGAARIVHRDVVDIEASTVRVNGSIQALLPNLRIVEDANDRDSAADEAIVLPAHVFPISWCQSVALLILRRRSLWIDMSGS
jgi:hypothetical protein